MDEEHTLEWFFIRYWEGGPHIRLRVKDLNNFKEFKNKLESEISQFWTYNNQINKIDYYKNNKLDGSPRPLNELPWYDNNSIQEIAYIPEEERYGGKNYIAEAEHVFYKSTLAIKNILKENTSFSKRLLFYLKLYENVLEKVKNNMESFDDIIFVRNCESYWMEQYGINNIEYYKKIGKNLGNYYKNNNVNIYSFESEDELEFYRTLINYIKNVGGQVSIKMGRSVLFSQMHMIANRLGIPIEYEYSVYEAIRRLQNECQKEVL